MDRAAKEAKKRFPDVKREDFEDEDEFFDCLADRNLRRLMWREGYRQAEKDIISIIESGLSELLSDAQSTPILRYELQDLIKRIKEEE